MQQAMRAVLFVMAGAAAVMVLDRVAGASHGTTAPTAGLELCATPKGQVMLVGAGGCRPGTTSAGVVAHQQSADDAFAHVSALEPRLAALEADNASLESKVSTLEADNASLESKVSTLESNNTALQSRISEPEATFAGVTRSGDVLKFEGMNLQVVNGLGSTDTTNASSNLIIGYNEESSDGDARTGSHNLVVGAEHTYLAFGGRRRFGQRHRGAVGIGVRWRRQHRQRSLILSIRWRTQHRQRHRSSVSGGISNTARGEVSSVSGGSLNFADGGASSLSAASAAGSSNRSTGRRALCLRIAEASVDRPHERPQPFEYENRGAWGSRCIGGIGGVVQVLEPSAWTTSGVDHG